MGSLPLPLDYQLGMDFMAGVRHEISRRRLAHSSRSARRSSELVEAGNFSLVKRRALA